MLYEFEAKDGKRVELDMSMNDAPDIGEQVVLSGKTYRRVYSESQICGAGDGSTRWPRFKSHSQPRWWKHHKGEFSPQGHPLIGSRKEADEACARESGEGEFEVKYGEVD